MLARRRFLRTTAMQEVYRALKAEQTARINFRDASLYICLITNTTVFSFFFQSNKSGLEFSFLIIAIIFFFLYVINDIYVSMLGKFFQEDMEDVFSGWEIFHKQMKIYWLQKLFRRIIEVGGFFIIPLCLFLYFDRDIDTQSIFSIVLFSLLFILGWSSTLSYFSEKWF